MANSLQPHEIGKRDLIEGLIKGLEVIRTFSSFNPRLSASEVAECTGLSRAAARRYLLTLVHIGLAMHERGGFRLTPKVAELGLHAPAAQDENGAQPLLERLTHQLQGNANVALVLLDRTDLSRASGGMSAG